jgi:hypothetical protein
MLTWQKLGTPGGLRTGRVKLANDNPSRALDWLSPIDQDVRRGRRGRRGWGSTRARS